MLETNGNAKNKSLTSKGKTWMTCRDAANLLGYTQRHILNLINKGKLSAEKDDDGRYYIQKSEFFRVYPDAIRPETPKNAEKSKGSNSEKLLEQKIKHLEEIVNEKNKHNEFLAEQLQNFTHEKSKMLDAINSHARLLEHKEATKTDDRPDLDSKKGFFEKLFKR